MIVKNNFGVLNKKILKHELRIVAWEITKRCNLLCVHCRASASDKISGDELNISKSFKLLDEISLFSKPIIILTGGEPLLRSDVFDIVDYGTKLGLRMVIALNGTLINKYIAFKIKDSGIKRVSISLDGSNSSVHDKFRGVNGSFKKAISGINYLKKANIPFQINTTITKKNLHDIEKILKLSEDLGAAAQHIFLLVPTGRGKYIYDFDIDSNEYEKILNWFYLQKNKTFLDLKATCAPHYYRILRQKTNIKNENLTFKTHGLDATTRGCLAGINFCFISYRGIVKPCGYTDINCGDINHSSFINIWENSLTFKNLRNLNKLKGKCGVCDYSRVCGGCRARAFETTGDYMNEEPLCSYNPLKKLH